MKVLIVEDDGFKRAHLVQCVRSVDESADIVERISYQSGVEEAISGDPDLIILDMSLPTFDIVGTERGYETRGFGGRDILLELQAVEAKSSVVVVTQFDRFGEGEEATTLDQLRKECEAEFSPTFVGMIYYHPSQDEWQLALRKVVSKVASRGILP